ncbi:MAG TPA: DUF2249 domain-containing protein [Opitutaceae bacterium]|nr:DUF2249 domain-containing protein [Opitutaceae bacterium]
MNTKHPSESIDPTRFDVREIPCRVKHAQIFQRWTELPIGGYFVLVNDHDPIPLYHQFQAQFPGVFTWEYLLRGPEEFQVKITRLARVLNANGSTNANDGSSRGTSSATDASKVFDVRLIPGRVKHAQIFQRWFDLAVGDYFILLNDHDPVPLRYQFTAEFPDAFSWEYLEKGPEEFRVKIAKFRALGDPAAKTVVTSPQPSRIAADVREIDARGLEPPEPLIRILDALESLPAATRLRAITDREPCHLFGEATQRGFRYDCNEQSDGSWLTVLERS